MIIVDFEIQDRVNTGRLIDPFSQDNLSNCRYNLRAGRAFAPETGEEIILSSSSVSNGRRQIGWCIQPSETLMLMTKEIVNMPDDLLATYDQLNHLAQKGLLLVNASIIEPGYSGPLSCYLINFSKKSIRIYPGSDIAKICFFQLSHPPRDLKSITIATDKYEQDLSSSAAQYPVSFLDTGGIEKRVSDSVGKSVNKSITFGGAFIAFLLLWATFEPFTNKYLFEKIGVATTTTHEDVLQLRHDMDQARADMRSEKDDLATATHDAEEQKKLINLEGQEKSLSDQISKLQKSLDHLKKATPQ